MSLSKYLTPIEEIISKSSVDISLITGSILEALEDPEVSKDVSVVVFNRPKYYPLWETDFYAGIHVMVPSVKAHDTTDKSLRKYRYRIRKLNSEGTEYLPRLVGASGYTSRNNNAPFSVGVLNTFLTQGTMYPELYKTRLKKEMEVVRRRWALEDNIDSDSYETTPYVMVMPLESHLYHYEQVEALEEVFEGCNVSIILFEDDQYEEVTWFEHVNNFYTRYSDETDVDLLHRFRNKELTILRKNIQKCSNIQEYLTLKSEFLKHFAEELAIWQEWATEDLKYSDEVIEEFTKEIGLKADLVYDKAFSSEFYKRRRKDFYGEKANYARIIEENKRKRYEEDNKFYRSLENVAADDVHNHIGYRGICKRIPGDVFRKLPKEKQEAIIAARVYHRERREGSKSNFSSYHQQYNKLKSLVTQTWNKDNKILTRQQRESWEKFRKDMRRVKAYADKWLDHRLNRIENYNNLTIKDLMSVPDEDILSTYCDFIKPDTRGVGDE